MRLIIGSYRADEAVVERALASIQQCVTGIDETVFVDDSGDEAFRKWLRQYGHVAGVGKDRQGYARAMQAATRLMTPPFTAWWEEDTYALAPVDLGLLADELLADPTLCQLVLRRQPWFEREKEIGVIEAMVERTDAMILRFQGQHGLILKHQAQFSANPGVWAPHAWEHGWPQCFGSEDQKTKYLVNKGLWFGWWGDKELVCHDSVRSGYGY
jgi:hypothetical protein